MFLPDIPFCISRNVGVKGWGTLLLILIIRQTGPAQMPVSLDSFQLDYSLTSGVDVWPEAPYAWDLKKLSRSWEFVPLREREIPYTFPGLVWTRATLINDSGQDIRDWYLYLGNSDRLDVYLLSSSGEVRHLRTGNLYSLAERDLGDPQHLHRVRFSLMNGDSVQVFARYESIRQYDNQIAWNLRRYEVFHDWEKFVLSQVPSLLWLGFVFTMVFFNFLMAWAARDRAFFFHGLYLLGLFTFMLDALRYSPSFDIFQGPPYIRNYINYVSVTIVDVGYLLFLQAFLGLDKLLPRWNRIFRWIIYSRLLVFLGVIVYYGLTMNEPLCDKIFAAFIILEYLLLIPVFLVHLSRTQSRFKYFTLTGTFFVFLTLVYTAILAFLGRSYHLWLIYISFFLEISIFTYALGYRLVFLQNLQQRAYQLRKLSEFKSRFFTNITHEFRSPLTAILGMVDSIRTNVRVDLQKRLHIIESNSEKLLRLINQILDISRAEQGQLQLNMVQGDIIPFLNYLTVSYQTLAQDQHIEVIFYSDEPSLTMDYDPERLETILTNLITNALKYTPEHGKISVGVKRIGEETLEIKVRDTGKGISAEHLPYIFDRFYQTHEDDGPQPQGSGVGLALVRELVTLMGGEIAADSIKGRGTTFTIRLPIRREAQPEDISFSLPAASEEQTSSTLAPANRLDFSGTDLPLALVVDDNSDILYYLRSSLWGQYRVEEAHNGREGWEKALELLPDIIITDVIMPEMDGLEFTHRLKEDERTCHIPVVMLTAKTGAEDRIAGLQQGADAYLAKPFRKEELYTILEKTIQLRSTLRDFYRRSSLAQEQIPLVNDTETRFYKKLVGIIEENLDDPQFDNAHLAQKLGMSLATLNRKIKAVTGEPPARFLRIYRLNRGRELLLQSELNVSEVAYQVGFSDPNHFSSTFRDHFGESPSEIRK